MREYSQVRSDGLMPEGGKIDYDGDDDDNENEYNDDDDDNAYLLEGLFK